MHLSHNANPPSWYPCGKRLPLPQAHNYTSQVPKRVCYIHIGPHKTGTTSIQVFLKENRSKLLKAGCFAPETRNLYGGHHLLVRQLCGLPVPEQHQGTSAAFASAVKNITCESIVISSETLDRLLLDRVCGRRFFCRI